MSKLEAFFMDTKFNLSLWKSSVLLPKIGISFILILGLIIFISTPINWMYIQKNSPTISKGKFKIPLSFKTLYTISGAEFIIGGMIQCLIHVKGKLNICLAPTGAQEMPMFVRSFHTCLEQSIFIFLGQR